MFRSDVPVTFCRFGRSAGAYIWALFCSGLRVATICELFTRVYILHPIVVYSRSHDCWIKFCAGAVISRVDTLRIPRSQLACHYIASWIPRCCLIFMTGNLWFVTYCAVCSVGVTGTVCMLPSISFRINSKWFPIVVVCRPYSECLP